MSIPFLLFHRGDSYYLAHTIAQLKQTNPDSPILFLGDRSNAHYAGVKHFNYDDYADPNENLAQYFDEAIITEKPFNRWHFFLIRKFFAIKEFLRRHPEVAPCVLIDSDVLIYGDIQKFVDKYKGYEMTVCNPFQPDGKLLPCANSGVAYIKNFEILETLCNEVVILLDKPGVKNPYLDHNDGIIHINEMLALGQLLLKNPNHVANTDLELNEVVVQSSMLNDYRFLIENKKQVIEWIDGKPHGIPVSDEKKRTPFFALHFHGHMKKIMYKYLTLRRPSVICQWLWNWGYYKVCKYPRRLINKCCRREVYPGM